MSLVENDSQGAERMASLDTLGLGSNGLDATGHGCAAPPIAEPTDNLQELSRRGSRAALWLALRGVVLNGMTFFGSIALARLLSPEDFGVYGVVGFVIAIWLTVGDFGLGASIVQQAAKPTREQLATVWTAQQAIAILAVASVWLAAPVVRIAMPSLPDDVTWMIRILSLGLLMASLRTLPAVMMERELRFGPLAFAEVAQQSTFYAAALTLAAFGAGAWSFVLGGVAQLFVGALVVNIAWPHRPTLHVDGATLRTLFGFGFAYQASNVVLALRDAPLPAIVGLVAGTVSAGLLNFAMRIAMTIASIDEMVGRIAFPAFSRLQSRREQQTRALDTALLMSGLLLVTAQFWLAAIAPLAIPFVFGERWNDAILPLQIVCIATLARFPARYLREAEFANGATGRGLAISIATMLFTLGCFVVGLVLGGLEGAAIGFLAGSVLGLLASQYIARRMPRLSWARYWLMIGSGALAAVVAALTLSGLAGAWGGGTMSEAGFEFVLVAGAVTSAVFCLVCLPLLALTNGEAIRTAVRLAARSIGRGRPSEGSPRG